jgi:RNA 3'-phosphate cyclase
VALSSRDPSLNWLNLDGSFGEGGGAILRVFAGIACFLHRPLYIYNIRKNRENPGLRTQHLVGIQSLVQLTNGISSPLTVGTTELTFQPGTVNWNTNCLVHIPTAGNIGLLSQTLYNALYIPLTHADEFVIHITGGGTYGTHAPGPEYLNHVLYPLLQRMGYKVELQILRQGFYPKGGAEAIIHIYPAM